MVWGILIPDLLLHFRSYEYWEDNLCGLVAGVSPPDRVYTRGLSTPLFGSVGAGCTMRWLSSSLSGVWEAGQVGVVGPGLSYTHSVSIWPKPPHGRTPD